MRILSFILLALFSLPVSTSHARPAAEKGPAKIKNVRLKIIETSDVHGNYFPYDFMDRKPGVGSLARIETYVKGARKQMGADKVLLLDNGDILQGQPTAYYYNYIDTTSTHACAAVLNYMRYDAAAVGNHDVETGHAVYDRWVRECKFPMLGANTIEVKTGKPYWKPYTIIRKGGVRIAVLGMLTPGIPTWLPENLWRGLRFDDLVLTAQKYMPEMRRQADLVVGLFHSGVGREDATGTLNENASLQVAREVPGFDIILCGHDHRQACRTIANKEGGIVQILNPAANAGFVAVADVSFDAQGRKTITGSIVDVRDLAPDADFVKEFSPQIEAVKAFTGEVIGYNKIAIDTRPSFFGPSAFVDFIHQLQMRISGASLSFAAPLTFDAEIPAGEIHMSDMFNLYRYENQLYTMRLSGKEIKDFLEYSYANWANTMQQPTDHLLIFNPKTIEAKETWQRLAHPNFNFDSAAGLIYTVDVRRPKGEKVHIISLANGEPFDLEKKDYLVAVNSYRGNGGGGLLTQGAGIPKEELPKRIVKSTDKDLRFYLMQEIKRQGTITPKALNQWKFVPEDWATKAAHADSLILFK